jgi:transposase
MLHLSDIIDTIISTPFLVRQKAGRRRMSRFILDTARRPAHNQKRKGIEK